LRRSILVGAIALVLSILIAAPVFAHECVNASKQDQAAGAQIVFGPNDEVLYITEGLQTRLDQGVIGPDGEGFHGLIAFDLDGDGVADASTYIVGPEGEVPIEAQFRGPACRGLTNIGIYLEQCVGA
jgi:hypothetical protein